MILGKANPLTKRASNSYFKNQNKQQDGKWHFTVSENIRTHTDESKVIVSTSTSTRVWQIRFKEEKLKIAFMYT